MPACPPISAAADPMLLPDDSQLAQRFGRKFAGATLVTMPPTWKATVPGYYTFVFFDEDLTREELARFFGQALALGLTNPRPVSRSLVEIASLFHPLLHQRTTAEKGSDFASRLGRGKWMDDTTRHLATPQTYMQSLLFLAGCTLSAAVIQDRFSSGNIESKLARLWQAAQYARRGMLRGVDAGEVEAFVVQCAGDTDAYRQLIDIKKMYSKVLGIIGGEIRTESKPLDARWLSTNHRERFGGVIDVVHRLLPGEVECIIAYGS